MNQCPPGSQGARGQLSTGSSGPLEFAAVDQKQIFQPNFSYGASLAHPAMGRLMRWDRGGRRYGAGQAVRRMWKGLGNVIVKIGIGLSVGRGVRFTSGQSCLWAAADFAGFFLDA